MEQTTAAEQRAFAVAMLKRAASLPRMRDGRRPPMHAEAVSEGERGVQNEEQKEGKEENKEDDLPPPTDEKEDSEPPRTDGKEESASEGTRVTSPEPPTRTKRRSRSRSRSRASKDLKGKGRATQSPLPSSVVDGNDSSPDEAPAPVPMSNIPDSPPVISPIPSRLATLQRSPFFMSPPMSPESPSLYPGTSPSTPTLPTLQALQLVRSNSAAARMMAMSKLTGEPYEPSLSPFPSPPPMPGRVSRNNTVSGGERSAARKNLLRRLGERTNAAGDQTSGGEEFVAPSPPPKGKRRRSRRRSQSASTAVDESDLPSTTPNTPVVPSTPLPPTPIPFDISSDPTRAPSTTPSQPESLDRNRESTLARLNGEDPAQYEPQAPRKRRSVVVEEEDDAPEEQPPPHEFNQLPSTPRRSPAPVGSLRPPHTSDAPSATSTDSAPASAFGVPVFLSEAQRTPSKGDQFPTSPFTTPWRERERPRDEDEEQVLYQAETHRQRQQSPYHDAFDREISWIADPVPESRYPVHDYEDDDNDDEADEPEPARPSSDGFSPHAYEDAPSRESTDSKDLVIDLEASPVATPSYVPPSPSSGAALSNTVSIVHASDDSSSPRVYPTRLSVASPVQSERSPSNGDFTDWDDARPGTAEPLSKRNGGDGGSTTWEKVKNTFTITRSASSAGRRSRTNSIVTRERRDQTDSSASRESGASLTSAKTDKGDSTFAYQQTQQLPMQSPSASASAISLAPQSSLRGGVSPIPPASMADLQKYNRDAKLFPFPGMKKLEERRNRTRGMSQSASTPDIVLALNGNDADMLGPGSSSSGNTPAHSPQMGRDRKLSHQASDTRLLAKYNNLNSPGMVSAPSSSSRVDYFNISPVSPPGPLNLKLPLPTNREGVKKWLSKNKLFNSQSSSSATTPSSPPVTDRAPNTNKKPSLSDLLRGRKENELIADWEEIGSEKSRTPTSASGSTLLGKQSVVGDVQEAAPGTVTPNGRNGALSDVEKTPKAKKIASINNGVPDNQYPHSDTTPPFPSPSDQPSSATPDPLSSLDDYPPHSTSGSSSNTSSQYSNYPSHDVPSQGAVVLERLDEMLGRGSSARSPMWASAIDDPPRKLVLSSPVLQVVNSNTVKDRFLFLFTDILVIAKPILQEQDTILDTSKPNPSDRKFVVKSVVQLNRLRFNADRDESQIKLSSYSAAPRHPLIRTFVHQFSKNADHAISWLFDKSGSRDDPVALGQLLFRTLDLDRARLGDYLSRRTSKFVLKAYLDGFGFIGLRVDKALRVFLHSVNVPLGSSHSYTPLEIVLDAFAGRWYEANAVIVAYDKDLAIRLVRAVVQLNDVLHGAITQEPGQTLYPKQNVTSRDFTEAFRRYDPRSLVSDELLNNIYNSIRRERLAQARKPSSASPDVLITIKRPLPPRLTYRIQSEPIILRIPHPDPHLSISLSGQDLIFDPPVLSFAKSSEASFRVTGTSLGSKRMTMMRSGPNAILYSGLPLSSSLVVERAFMRNTFQMAFSNHEGLKRRYMFSVDDPLVRHQWTVSLKQQIDIASPSTSLSSSSPGSSKFHRAAEHTAFKVLQETLIGGEDTQCPPPPAAIDRALYRLGQGSNGDAWRFPNEQHRGNLLSPLNGHVDVSSMSAHVRSKSRSAVYHRHGPGKMEPELSNKGYDSRDSRQGGDDSRHEPQSRSEGRLWSGRALEIQCQQNSSIALVLAYLQVGAPDHDRQGS